MYLFHRTTEEKAMAILKEGFRERTDTWGTGELFPGVWFSADYPLDEDEGAYGNVVLRLDIPEDVIAEFEWIQDIGYREFLIREHIVNQYGPPQWLEEDEIPPHPFAW